MHRFLPLLVLALPSFLHADPNLGLVARYRFETLADGVLSDDSGQGNHLRAQGKLELRPGKVGQAVCISGAGYPQAPASPSLELGGAMTLEAWIKPEFHPASGMRILDRATIGGNDGFMFDTWPEGHLRLIIAPGLLRDEVQLPVNEWVHVAATYSDETGECRLYRNGEVVAETVMAGKLKPSQHPLNLGASQGGGDRFTGLMDEVRIYKRCLAQEEIMAHFQGKEIEPPATALGLPAPPLPALLKGDRAQVDYAAQCARNDLVYRAPAVYPFEAMRLGNGNLGVTLWNEGGMTFQVNNGSWRVGNEPLSSGRVTLSTPALSQAQPARFEQRLRLWDGTVTTSLSGPAGDAEATAFAVEGEDCLVFRCRETGQGPRSLTLHLWRPSAHFVTGPDYVVVTEAADHKEAFLATAMCLLVSVDGADVKTDKVDDRTLRLTFTPRGGEYTVYLANPLLRGTEAEALKAAEAMLARVRTKGHARLLAECQAFWHSFWPRSFVHLKSPNGEAEFVENLWYLFFHDLASMSRQTLCPKFNGGNWLTWDDLRHWGGGYWHQNTRELFWPTYGAGHTELSDPFFDLYGRAAKVARESGQGMGVDGYFIPEWIPIAPGVTIRPIKPPGGYTAFIFTVSTEIALQAMWRYEFTGDEKWLRDYAYPLLKGSLDFYLGYAKKGPDGKYHLDPADAQESYWLVRDPAQDLAALRWGLPLALKLSEKLKLDEALRPRWQDLLDNLAPFPVDTEKNMIREADLKPTDQRQNSENVANYSIYPFGVFGIGKPGYDLALSTFQQRPVGGMGNGWEPAAVAAARLGLGDEAAKLLLAHLQSNMRGSAAMWYSPTTVVYPNGQSDVPYYDTSGTDAQTVQEMLLQSHDGLVRLAPAWPVKWQAQYCLHARGGFVVTADVDQGQVRYALLESTRGGQCRLANPWSGVAVVTCAGKPVLRSKAAVLEFPTKAGQRYLVERATAPVAKLAAAPLKPTAAAGLKFVGRKLAKYPNWSATLALGIDEQGRTPARAWMRRAVEGFAKQLAEATAGLTDLTTGKVTAEIVGKDDKVQAAPRLTDGQFGPRASVEVPHEGAVLLDLGAARQVGAVAFSGDRTALFQDQACAGYTVETSTDGQAWAMARDSQKSGAAPPGHALKITTAAARYIRLRLWGQYGRPVLLDEVAVYGTM